MREIFAEWLLIMGCQRVRTAADGAEAIDALQVEPVELLISDIRMPIMDGITMVHRLSELGVHVPAIIFISGFGDIDVRQLYNCGVEAFLAKPLHREELMVRIDQALADRSELWLQPSRPEPRQTMSVVVSHVSADPVLDNASAPIVRLGRGGFSTKASEPLGLGAVAFTCHVAGDPNTSTASAALSGHGFVRWFSKTDYTVGIEFAYLDPSCRDWVLREISRAGPHSYIPLL